MPFIIKASALKSPVVTDSTFKIITLCVLW